MPRWCNEIQNIKNKDTTSKSSRKKGIAYKRMVSTIQQISQQQQEISEGNEVTSLK